MMISVAMTTFNGEKYIIKQLETIRKQTCMPDEVIICDDRSKDNTVQLIKDYISSYKLTGWKIIVNQNNLGFIENFRQAVSLTSGDIIFLADQDDEWKPEKLNTLSSLMRDNLNIDVLVTSVDFIDGEGKLITPNSDAKWCKRMQKTQRGTLQQIDYMELCSGNFAPGCTLCMRRSLADEFVCFDNSWKIPHDWLISLLAARKNSCYMLFEPLINYRLHSNNTIGVAPSSVRSYDKDLQRLNDLVNRIGIGIDSSYRKQKALKDYKIYIDSRRSLYTEKTLRRLLSTLWNSIRIMNKLGGILKKDCRDILFYTGKLYKE